MMDPLTRLGWAIFGGSTAAAVMVLVSAFAEAARVWPGALLAGLMTFGTSLAVSGKRRA